MTLGHVISVTFRFKVNGSMLKCFLFSWCSSDPSDLARIIITEAAVNDHGSLFCKLWLIVGMAH